jgi:hypothetical protein
MQMIRKYILAILAAFLLLCAMFGSTFAQTAKPLAPDALVTDLYRVHNQKKGPFYQTRNRALLDKYFAKSLADLIWKDRIDSKGEVGVIDGDPLYDAQDFDIKNLVIGKATNENGGAKVIVTFENIGQKKTITFLMVNGRTGWRINDIDYGGDEGTMRGWFKKAGKQ